MLLLSPLLLAQSKLKRIFFSFLKEKSLEDPGEAEIFFVERFACGTQGNGSVFKALRPLKSNETKCIALDGNKELSLKTFDKDIPHPDTIFLITKA